MTFSTALPLAAMEPKRAKWMMGLDLSPNGTHRAVISK
jgi:hypothetical protein